MPWQCISAQWNPWIFHLSTKNILRGTLGPIGVALLSTGSCIDCIKGMHKGDFYLKGEGRRNDGDEGRRVL